MSTFCATACGCDHVPLARLLIIIELELSLKNGLFEELFIQIAVGTPFMSLRTGFASYVLLFEMRVKFSNLLDQKLNFAEYTSMFFTVSVIEESSESSVLLWA